MMTTHAGYHESSNHRHFFALFSSSFSSGKERGLHDIVRVGLLLLTCTAILMMSFPGIFAATQATSQADPVATVTTATAGTDTVSTAVATTATATTAVGTTPLPGNSTGDFAQSGIPIIPAGLPVGAGCYVHVVGATEWRAEDCTPQSVASKVPKPVIGGGTSGIDGLSVIGTGKLLTEGYVTDWFSTFSGEKDTSWGSDSFSIQTNTNTFTGGNGQLDAVQFTEQYSPQGLSQDCVWNIDVTSQNYENTCVSTPAQPLSAKFGADVVGEVTSRFVCIPLEFPLRPICFQAYYLTSVYMTPSGTWAVTAADTYGLHSAWTQTSGTILGLGGGSQATFTHPTKVGSNVGVYSSGLNSATTFNTVNFGYWTDESSNLNYQSMSNTCYNDGYCVLWTQQGN
jgi:hypothetical protein